MQLPTWEFHSRLYSSLSTPNTTPVGPLLLNNAIEMKKTHHNLSSSPLLPLVLTLFLPSSSLAKDPLFSFQGFECGFLNCGEGKCVESSSSVFGVDCECSPGWNKLQLGSVTLPSCIVPNCTIDIECGSGSPSPAPQPTSTATNFQIFNICSYVYCGDGNCQNNGTFGYSCECNAGTRNFLNLSSLACFKPCYLGANCTGLNISFKSPPTLPPSPPPPHPSSSASPITESARIYAEAAAVAGGAAICLVTLWW